MPIDLALSGFQSIRNPACLTLEGLTVIEGESNIGKSAIVRLIHAAFSNKSGTYYISTGEERASLEWRDPVNHLIWEKNGSAVSYLVNQKKLNKPGRGVVPDEVGKVGICEIRTSDKHKYWPQIQFQGEPPFIISERSPAIAAELLGSSQEVLKVSRALRLVRGDISKDTTKLHVLEEQHKLISDRTKLLEEAYTSSSLVYQELETSFNSQAISQQKFDTLTGLSDRLNRIKLQENVFLQVKSVIFPDPLDIKKVEYLSGALIKYIKIQDVIKASENLVPLDITGEQVTNKFKKLFDLYQRSLALGRKLNCLRFVAAYEIAPKLEIQELYSRHEKLKSLQERYISLSRARTAIENNLIDANKRLKDVEKESKELKLLVQDLETCPFCDAPIHDGKYCVNLVV